VRGRLRGKGLLGGAFSTGLFSCKGEKKRPEVGGRGVSIFSPSSLLSVLGKGTALRILRRFLKGSLLPGGGKPPKRRGDFF